MHPETNKFNNIINQMRKRAAIWLSGYQERKDIKKHKIAVVRQLVIAKADRLSS